jgi:putative ABC transport system permease protein
MLKNYLIVAIRSFLRQGLFSFINVVGLATGLACALFIFLWVSDEVKKDRFHADIDRIYHVVLNLHNPEGTITWAITPGPLAEEIRSSIPEVELVAPVANDGPRLIQVEEKSYLSEGYFTHPDFFSIFSYRIVEGNDVNPLEDPSSIVLTKSLAEKLFGDESAVGKTVTLRSENELHVTAVMEDVPKASSLGFEYIAHFDVHKRYRKQDWSNSDYPLFIKFQEDFNAAETQVKINKQVATTLGYTEEESKRLEIYLQPFADRYLYAGFENGHPVTGRIKYVKIFSVVAVFILVVACINFTSLATARAGIRYKEIGVRKVVGARRRLIMTQFITESVLTAAVSMILALFIAELFMPFFNTIVSKDLIIQYSRPGFMLPVILIVVSTGLLAGTYPAFTLSRVQPVSALKSGQVSVRGRFTLNRALVVFQFALSVVLVVSALVVGRQIAFIQSKSLGYNKENVMVMPARGIRDYNVFKDQLLAIPGVSKVAFANEEITNVQNQNSSFSWEGKPEDNRLYVRTVVVGYDFIETLGLKIAEGRAFSRDHNDTANVIINQKLASLMNTDQPLGLSATQWGLNGKVVGIVEDFHIRSISESMDPVVLLFQPKWTGRFYVRLDADKIQEAVSSIGTTWKTASPAYPFEYSFLDESFDRLYREEEVISTLSIVFTGMAILISALGLLGLAAYSTERKRKEISIRKVLGATVGGLLMRMSTEFLVLTCIALLIGCPVAYYLMAEFLSGYAYHVSIDYSIFVTTTVGLLLTTLLVISFQLIKAALDNPVNNLRNE